MNVKESPHITGTFFVKKDFFCEKNQKSINGEVILIARNRNLFL